eukprot:CAMPEP_0204581076 /NCGR_PEP_ID=MMETSP0661-20131031/44428_1 /ASSEMBLY_ACC=CAM_ASM_000606 /TAXON_ID=109239 /ORGANISM="Alexandrium margalefi, Strain AMGDE01CS-322" /LENGTH=83 /DNA_ID=CAMNT_0051590215 /DNA_START=44 /DNA_END=292 /DNA_ORIENTATION=+
MTTASGRETAVLASLAVLAAVALLDGGRGFAVSGPPAPRAVHRSLRSVADLAGGLESESAGSIGGSGGTIACGLLATAAVGAA